MKKKFFSVNFSTEEERKKIIYEPKISLAKKTRNFLFAAQKVRNE